MAPKVTMADRLVVLAMAHNISGARMDRYVWPTLENLVRWTKLSKRQVYRSLEALERQRLITRVANPLLVPRPGAFWSDKVPVPPDEVWEIANFEDTPMEAWAGFHLQGKTMRQFWAQNWLEGPRLIVLLSLVVRLNKADNQVWVGNAKIAAMTGLCDKTVRVSLEYLRRMGIIGYTTKVSNRAPKNCRTTVWRVANPRIYSSLVCRNGILQYATDTAVTRPEPVTQLPISVPQLPVSCDTVTGVGDTVTGASDTVTDKLKIELKTEQEEDLTLGDKHTRRNSACGASASSSDAVPASQARPESQPERDNLSWLPSAMPTRGELGLPGRPLPARIRRRSCVAA